MALAVDIRIPPGTCSSWLAVYMDTDRPLAKGYVGVLLVVIFQQCMQFNII